MTKNWLATLTARALREPGIAGTAPLRDRPQRSVSAKIVLAGRWCGVAQPSVAGLGFAG